MPVEFTQRPLTKIDFAVDDTKTLAIPRDKSIRRMILRFIINLTTTAATPTYTEDDILDIIKKIRLVMDGSDNKFNVSARKYYYVEQFEKQTTPAKVAPTTSVSTTADAIVVLTMDFANDRLDRNDLSALLQARKLSSLDLEIDWGKAADLATANVPTVNVSDSSCEVEILEVSGEVEATDESGEETSTNVFDLDVDDIRETESTVEIPTADKQSFDADTVKENITPAPANILMHMLMVTDNKIKTDALLTSIKIQQESPTEKRLIQRTYKSLREEGKTEHALESIPVGIVFLDYVDLFDGGLENSGNEGDTKWRFLTKAAGTAQEDFIQIFTRSVSVAKE